MERDNLEVRDFFVPNEECVLYDDADFEHVIEDLLCFPVRIARIARVSSASSVSSVSSVKYRAAPKHRLIPSTRGTATRTWRTADLLLRSYISPPLQKANQRRMLILTT